jgi:hypothetical protein
MVVVVWVALAIFWFSLLFSFLIIILNYFKRRENFFDIVIYESEKRLFQYIGIILNLFAESLGNIS